MHLFLTVSRLVRQSKDSNVPHVHLTALANCEAAIGVLNAPEPLPHTPAIDGVASFRSAYHCQAEHGRIRGSAVRHLALPAAEPAIWILRR